jgi:hypothetical protein
MRLRVYASSIDPIIYDETVSPVVSTSVPR